jgi:hypothetical protein
MGLAQGVHTLTTSYVLVGVVRCIAVLKAAVSQSACSPAATTDDRSPGTRHLTVPHIPAAPSQQRRHCSTLTALKSNL